MPRIVLQAGHVRAKFNSIPELRKSTGAPGEQELTQRITDRVAYNLRQRRFEVKQTDSCANSDKDIIAPHDWDLFLAIHGEADMAGQGGTIATADPSVDGAATESFRIKEAIRSEYFKHSEIDDKNYSSANIGYYYMWKVLSDKTPCVLIELGQVEDAHDKVLLADTDRIANALTRGICKAFDVAYEPLESSPPVPEPPKPPEAAPGPVANPSETTSEKAEVLVDNICDNLRELIRLLFPA